MTEPRLKQRPFLTFAAAAGLAGCGSGAEQMVQPAPAARLPAQVCDRAAQSLQELRARGTFEYDARGEATIDQEQWLQLGEAGRDGLGTALGYHAACSAAEPVAERQITVRGETGQVLDSRIVSTAVQPGFRDIGGE